MFLLKPYLPIGWLVLFGVLAEFGVFFPDPVPPVWEAFLPGCKHDIHILYQS